MVPPTTNNNEMDATSSSSNGRHISVISNGLKLVLGEQVDKAFDELENRILELKGSVGDIEKERDFYFGKCDSIELFLQIKQDKHFENCDKEDIVRNLFRVLYATVDDDVQVDDDGEVVPGRPGFVFASQPGETGNVSKGNIKADLSDALGSTASQHIGITDGAPAAVTVKLEGGVAAGSGKMGTTEFLTTSDENQKAKENNRLVIQDLRGIIAEPIDKEIPEMDAKHKAVIETVIKRLEELWSIDIA